MSVIVNIAKDFSRNPAGRYTTDGPYSGEAFRDSILLPALKKEDVIEVILDGALGFGSSFLEEAFGGLVRKCGFTKTEIRRRLRIRSSLKTYESRIWKYIDEAQPQAS